ncbi:MAG: hypothetical protein J5658_08860 [Prevotella sp.]|nr:hypothetical protein [Prevotella sp.]
MTEEKVYRKHEIMCELEEDTGHKFTMTLTAVTMDKPNKIKLLFEDYAELKSLAQYILSMAYDLKHPNDGIKLKDVSGSKIVCDSDGVTHIYPKGYGK